MFKFQTGVLIGFAIATALLFGTIIFWEKVYPLPYRVTQPVTQPSSSPADLGELTARVENLENDQDFNLKALEWKIDQKLLIISWVALFISSVAGFIGVKTYNDLDKVVKEKVNTAFEKELYQLDPTNLPIHLVINPEMADKTEAIWNRLKLTGLNNIQKLDHLDKTTRRGVTIILIGDKQQEAAFAKFLRTHKMFNGKETTQRYLNPEKAAFIAYTLPSKWLADETLAEYENLATANLPATVASMVLVVGRGLKNRED